MIDNIQSDHPFWHQLCECSRLAQSRTEATNADPRTVPERRYDLDECSGELGIYGRHDVDTANALIALSARWLVRNRIDDTLVGHFCALLGRYTRTTDEDGIECWVRGES